MHVLIPYAISDDLAAQGVLRELRLPALQTLLAHLRLQSVHELPEDSPVSAHERVQALAQGLDPQAPAWAAQRAHELGLPDAQTEAWAFITPCHWELGQTRVTLRNPQALDLREEESRALLTAMQPYFAEDGIALHYEQPLRWLAQGEPMRGLATASPERVIGRDVAPWLPASPALRRLQNEMQMLLYTHAVTEARAQRGAWAVNSFWLSGSGAAKAPAPSLPETPDPSPLQIWPELMPAAVQGDWPAWARAWQALDARLQPMLPTLDSQPGLALTLCSELRAQHYGPGGQGLLARLRHRFKPVRLFEILATA